MKHVGRFLINIFLVFFLVGNLYIILRQHREKTAFDLIPTNSPTLLLILSENECGSCVEELQTLNEVYPTIRDEHGFELYGMIVSKTKTDKKGFSKAFDFPFIVTDNFGIIKQLNIAYTPLLLALSAEKSVLFADILPFGAKLDKTLVLDVILDRLHYSTER